MAEDEGQEERIIPRIEKDDSRLFIGIGAVFTFLWIAFFLVLYSQTELPDDWSLNHLGDFLAGVFAPLAVFWFVLGFFLQIKEIRYQRIEINRLGGFTERQAHASERQADLSQRELEQGKELVKPKLVYEHPRTSVLNGKMELEIYFKNIGAPALNAEVFSSDADVTGLDLKYNRNIYPNKDEPYYIKFKVLNSAILPVLVTLDYKDSEGKLYRHQGSLGAENKENMEFFNSQRRLSA